MNWPVPTTLIYVAEQLEQTLKLACEWLQQEPERAWFRTYDAAIGLFDREMCSYSSYTGGESYREGLVSQNACRTATRAHGFIPESYKGAR